MAGAEFSIGIQFNPPCCGCNGVPNESGSDEATAGEGGGGGATTGERGTNAMGLLRAKFSQKGPMGNHEPMETT